MKNLWDPAEAATLETALARRLYTSRLIGGDSELVLYGGGNTSVKDLRPTIFGTSEEVIVIKGSGRDLRGAGPEDFVALRLDYLRALAALDHLSDLEMVRHLAAASLDPAAPPPSVESLLHAILPYRYVDHAHADAVLAITNTPSGASAIIELFGDEVMFIPYVMPGFALAKEVAKRLDSPGAIGARALILSGHGIFTFADDAAVSYGTLVEFVTRCEDYLASHGAWDVESFAEPPLDDVAGSPLALAEVRSKASALAGFPLLQRQDHRPMPRSFCRRADLAEIAGRGPATPDHVIRTKPFPLVGPDLDGFAKRYVEYFEANASRSELTQLDPAPRVVLDPELGLCTLGRTPGATVEAAEIYLHTIATILRAEALERWQPPPLSDIFAVEYWGLEQAKLERTPSPGHLAGEVAVVTGAASGIGRACALALLGGGAAVCGLDLSDEVTRCAEGPAYLGVRCDLRESGDVALALEQTVRQFGGVDVLVLAAGTLPPSANIDTIETDVWRRTFATNVDTNLSVMRLAYPYLKIAPRGGRVVVIGSKNVAAPGPGASAYSASKAAQTQLARVAALEWSADRIRVNVVHPDAVFDTGLWTKELIEERAAKYGLTPEQYRSRNLLGAEITSVDVAGVVEALCSAAFSKVTGAQVPIDGGNDRVI